MIVVFLQSAVKPPILFLGLTVATGIPMDEPNPYQSPAPHSDQPRKPTKPYWRQLLGLLLWVGWSVCVLVGILWVVLYLAPKVVALLFFGRT